MIHSDKIAEIFKHRNILREKYKNWVGYEYTANTLIALELLSTSHCVGGWRYKKTEYLPWFSGDSAVCLRVIVTGVSRERGTSTKNKVIDLSVYKCVFDS